MYGACGFPMTCSKLRFSSTSTATCRGGGSVLAASGRSSALPARTATTATTARMRRHPIMRRTLGAVHERFLTASKTAPDCPLGAQAAGGEAGALFEDEVAGGV